MSINSMPLWSHLWLWPLTFEPCMGRFMCYGTIYSHVVSYPGHVKGGKSGLVSTVCACATDSRSFLRMSPIMYKLHMVVMWRNNQTRYMAYSVFTRWWLPLSETQGVTWHRLRYKQRWFHRHCACSWKQMAESHSRWTSQIPWVATGIRLYHRGYIWLHPAALLSTWNLPF